MQACVIVQRGDEVGRRCDLESPRFAIGRGPENDLVLGDDTVARYHAVITGRDGHWAVIDLGSAHAVTVEGVALEPGQPHLLRHGDRIQIGRRDRLVFRQAVERAGGELAHTLPMRMVTPPLAATVRLPVAASAPDGLEVLPGVADAPRPASPPPSQGEGWESGEGIPGDDDPTLTSPIVRARSVIRAGWWGYHLRRRAGSSE